MDYHTDMTLFNISLNVTDECSSALWKAC